MLFFCQIGRWTIETDADCSADRPAGIGQPLRRLRLALQRHEAQAPLPRLRKGTHHLLLKSSHRNPVHRSNR